MNILFNIGLFHILSAPIILLFCVGLYLTPAYANSQYTQQSRYVTLKQEPLPAQTDLLLQIFDIKFPDTVQTVGEAMHFLLRYSGYSLVIDEENVLVTQMLNKPLPLVHRHFGPMSLRDGLGTLAGHVFLLQENPLYREVTFTVETSVAEQFSEPAGSA